MEGPPAKPAPSGVTFTVGYPRASDGKKVLRALGIAAIIVVLVVVILSVAALRTLSDLLGPIALGARDKTAPWSQRPLAARRGGPAGR